MAERQYNEADRLEEEVGVGASMGWSEETRQQIQQQADSVYQQDAGTIFEEGTEDETPFDFPAEPDAVDIVPTQLNPVSSQISAMALAGKNISNKTDTATALAQARAEAESSAGLGEDRKLRTQIALDRISRKRSELRLNVPKFTQSDLYPQGLQYQSQVAEENLEQQVRTATEREAIDNIQDLAAAGDYTQARILMNRMRPENTDLVRVWQDNMTKSLMLAQLAEKYKQEDNHEGWLASVYTGLLSLFQPSSASYLGNVDDGVGDFVQRNAFTRFFTPGQDLQNQAQAIWNMSAEELSDYLPQLDTNIRSNSSYLGVTNPDKLMELIGYFESPLSDEAASELSTGANVENALLAAPGVGIVPYKLAAKSVSLPFTMVRAGARKEAAAAIAGAHEALVREGAAGAARAGLDEAGILDEMMPTMINPEAGGPKLNVSLSGEANAISAQAEEILEAWSPRTTERFANEEELIKARDAKLAEIEARYGAPATDYEVVSQKLADGTHTRVLRVTFGNPKGGLFATEAEALGWRASVGFGEGVVRLEKPLTKEVHPRELGYTTVTYHGTGHNIEGNFRPSIGGMFGSGVYVTLNPRLAGSYADVSAKYGIGVTGANLHPLLVNEKKIFGFVGATRDFTVGEVEELYRLVDVPIPDSVKQYLKSFEDSPYGASGKEASVVGAPHEIIDDLLEALRRNLGDDGHYTYDATGLLRQRLDKKGFQGHLGHGHGQDNSLVIWEGENIKPLFTKVTINDPSGGYANILEFDIPETAFYTHLDTPEQGATSRFLKNISQTSDEGLYGKGLIADQKANRMYKQIEKDMRDAYKGLRGKERLWFDQTVAFQSNEKRWLEPPEMEALLERAMGKPPRQQLINALQRYRVLNDVEFLMRRDGVYRGKVIRGFESVKFSVFDDTIDLDARIDYSPTLAPKTRAYDVSADIHYVGEKTLSNERMKELSAMGYVLVRTEKPVKLKDGTIIDTFVGKKNDFTVSRLRRDQLGYFPGGHRIYLSKYQVKQASYIKQPDTGSKALSSPNTFVMAGNIRDARKWASTMNAARIAVKNKMDADYLNQNVFKGEKGFPTGEDFIDQVNKGLIDKDAPFEALYDRDLPSVYKEAGPDLEAMLGEDAVTGVNSYFRTTGRMYYSSKGDHMLDTYGELAPTVDPIKAQAMALFNVTRLSASFGDFKESAITRWVNKYRPYLNVRDSMNIDEAKSAYSIFNRAEPMEGIDFDLKQQMLGQRESIKRILGFETDLDRNYRHWMRSTAEWIIGDSDNVLRRKASEGVFWLYENNPVTFLRGLVFDLKLGLFNIGQVFIQGSTMASALALNPRHGKYGLASAIPSMAYFLSKGSENVLERMAKNGIHRLAGFSDVAEWKTYIREAQKSGFFDLGGSHVMVNDLGPERFASSIRSGTQHVREMGRWFFYNVEVMNRLVAHRIAYGEALERFGTAKWDDNLFQEFIARRAENYSFNMSNASKSWWQTGMMSIPTQFWAYNVRMIEALVGKNFTPAQKVRLLGAQIAMAGTAGVPLVAGLVDMTKTHYGVEPDINTAAGVLHRGLADFMVHEMFGADVNIGERWGTGSWSSDLLRDIFGYSEYNQKTFADIAFGATYGITKSVLKPLFGDALPVALRWMSHESGQEEINMTGEELMTMFRQISSVNHALQAMEVYNYGLLKSSKGTILANDLPSEDAVFVALGFSPNEMNELTVMTGYMKQRKEAIDDAAKQIATWRTEALTRPDMFEENAKKVNAFVKLLPADIRRDVLKRAHREVDPSIYASIKERFDKTRQTEQILQRVEENGSTN